MSHHPRILIPIMAACLLAPACTPTAPATPAPAPAPHAAAPAAAPNIKKDQKRNAGITAKVSSIGLDELFILHQEGRLLLLDSRPAYYHQLGHIPGSLSLPKDGGTAAVGAMEDQLKQALASDRTIVVYCSGTLCADARTVARRIASAGYPARIFSGGWDAWRDAGLPVE
jgi:rhodanese-related sulfurtransferase